MPLVCVEKGLKRDQGGKGVQVCGRHPRSGGQRYRTVSGVYLAWERTGNCGKVCVGRGGRVCRMCVFCKFVGDFIQQAVFKASSVTGPELGPEGESEMNETQLQELFNGGSR